MKYEPYIKSLQNRFEDNPLNYFVEAELQFELKNIIMSGLESETINISETVNRPGTEKHRSYTDKALEADKIDRVHGEVRLKEIGNGNIDLIAFQDGIKAEMESGNKIFEADDVDAAFELKFVKNLDYAQPGKMRDIREDIERLEELPSHIEKHMIIFANKDLFRDTGGGTQHSHKLEKLRNNYNDVRIHYSHIPIQSQN